MIKTEQAADDSGVYTLQSLAGLNCCDMSAVLKDSEFLVMVNFCSFFFFFLFQTYNASNFTERMMLI